MVEGRGSKDFAATRGMAFSDPASFGRLIRILQDATVEYLVAQVEAGAEALMLFDTWAGLLPPSQFRRWVIEPSAAIARAVRKRCPNTPIIGFPRLAGPMITDYAARAMVAGTAWAPCRCRAIWTRWRWSLAVRRWKLRHAASWVPCVGGRSSSIWATGSFRRRRPNMSRSSCGLFAAAKQDQD